MNINERRPRVNIIVQQVYEILDICVKRILYNFV